MELTPLDRRILLTSLGMCCFHADNKKKSNIIKLAGSIKKTLQDSTAKRINKILVEELAKAIKFGESYGNEPPKDVNEYGVAVASMIGKAMSVTDKVSG